MPIIVGLVGAQGDMEEMKPLQEAMGLLPSLAKVVEKFDYLQAKLSVKQKGDLPHSYLTRSVTLVRSPAEAEPVRDDHKIVPASALEPVRVE